MQDKSVRMCIVGGIYLGVRICSYCFIWVGPNCLSSLYLLGCRKCVFCLSLRSPFPFLLVCGKVIYAFRVVHSVVKFLDASFRHVKLNYARCVHVMENTRVPSFFMSC